MTRESWIAGALTVCCAVAALGSWFTHQPARRDHATRDKALFTESDGVARLDVQGMIVDSGDGGVFGGGATSAEALLAGIKRIREDGCKVVLLNLNSPGGTASASQSVYDELQRLKREKGVKVVASMGDLAASGAYYIAAAADEIVANPATLTGSIGVIMHTANYQGLMGKLGVSEGAIKSGAHKDIGSPYRPMTADERALLQSLIDDTYQQFLEAVATGRRLPVAEVRPIADGRIFTGRQALKVKLVDKLGNYTVAVEEARRLGGLGADAKVKDYSQEEWRDYLRGIVSSEMNPLGRMLGVHPGALTMAPMTRVPLLLYE